jgi:hypothetical protein
MATVCTKDMQKPPRRGSVPVASVNNTVNTLIETNGPACVHFVQALKCYGLTENFTKNPWKGELSEGKRGKISVFETID